MKTGRFIGLVAMAVAVLASVTIADVYYQTGFETSEGYPVGGTDVTVVGNDGWTASTASTNWYYQLTTSTPISGAQSATLAVPMSGGTNPSYYRTFSSVSPDVIYFSMDINMNNVTLTTDKGVHFYLLNELGVSSTNATAQFGVVGTATGNVLYARNSTNNVTLGAVAADTSFNVTAELFLHNSDNNFYYNIYVDGVKANESLLYVRSSASWNIGGVLILGEAASMPESTSKIFMDNIYVANVIPEPASVAALVSLGSMMILRRRK